jgi:uncharacterized protein YndB with AHSA1/START domain
MERGFSTIAKTTILTDREQVWPAWATPDGMDSWFSTKTVMDFREGGSFTNGDGDICEYLAIVPHESIRFTWKSRDHAPGSYVTVAFEDLPDGVEVTLTHENLYSQEDAYDLTEGWTWALDSLKSYLETGKPIGFEDWKATQRGQE